MLGVLLPSLIMENNPQIEVSNIVPVKDLEKLLGISYSRIQAILTELKIERFRGLSGAAKYIAHEDFVMLQEYIRHTKSGGTLLEFKASYVREIPTRVEDAPGKPSLATGQDNTQDYPVGYLALTEAIESAVRNALPPAPPKPSLSIKERLETLLLVSQESIPLPTKDLAHILGISANTLRGKKDGFSLYGFTFYREKVDREIHWNINR